MGVRQTEMSLDVPADWRISGDELRSLSREPETTMLRYEYREEYIDFRQLTIPSHKVPASARVKGAVTGTLVPIASVRFYYRGDSQDQMRQAGRDGWSFIRSRMAAYKAPG